ncbi:hypothetical protein ACGFX4_31345 [Kitasatospora sp. NPDC048365]|uniref:hypothetical protein n=1 Tax=Kitasatospora sp. NPDC048365 TaxID=3364050 RepID=UPI00371D34A9
MSATSFATTSSTTSTAAAYTRLRRFLALDAAVTGGNGLAYLAASGPLAELLGVGRGLLLEVGAFLLAFGLAVGVLAARRRPPVLGVKLVVDANLLWPVLSIVALEAWLSPSTAGLVWIPMQALTVAGFAALQLHALRTVRATT